MEDLDEQVGWNNRPINQHFGLHSIWWTVLLWISGLGILVDGILENEKEEEKERKIKRRGCRRTRSICCLAIKYSWAS